MTWGKIALEDQLSITDWYLGGGDLQVYADSHSMEVPTLKRRVQETMERYRSFVQTIPLEGRQDYLLSLTPYPHLQKFLAEGLVDSEYSLEQVNEFRLALDNIGERVFGFSGEDLPALPNFPKSNSNKFDPVIVEGDTILISDVEIPDHDHTMMRLALALGIRHNIKRLIVLGDFMAMDAFSTWAKVNKDERISQFSQEFDTAINVTLAWFTWFDEIVIVEGNHERRINKITNGEIYLKWLLGTAFKFLGRGPEVTRLNHIYIDTERGPWLAAHPLRGSSTVPGAMPKKMWIVERLPKVLERKWGRGTKPHIVTAHTHLFSFTTTPDASRQVMEIGCSRDRARTGYKQDKATFPEWTQGIGLIKRGYGRAFPVEHTDWEYELGPELYNYVFDLMEDQEDVARDIG